MIIATDTTSYPNMHLDTISLDGTTVKRYELRPNDGYVIHDHAGCNHGDEFLGIPAECYYSREVSLPPMYDLSLINSTYEAVLESTVPADHIYGVGDNDHEVV